MSIYKSTQTVIMPKTNKPVPIWKIDTNTMTVTYFNPDTLTVECRTYCTDFIRYHIHYSESKCPEGLHRLVNEGKIIRYLDEIGTESWRSNLPSGRALETERQLLSESCSQR